MKRLGAGGGGGGVFEKQMKQGVWMGEVKTKGTGKLK